MCQNVPYEQEVDKTLAVHLVMGRFSRIISPASAHQSVPSMRIGTLAVKHLSFTVCMITNS